MLFVPPFAKKKLNAGKIEIKGTCLTHGSTTAIFLSSANVIAGDGKIGACPLGGTCTHSQLHKNIC